jgi:tetratricopeptide (TPR) repeat protein
MGAALGLGQQAQQTAAPPSSTSPVAPQPVPKSPEEAAAVQAIFNAITPDARIQACDKLVQDFPKTEFAAVAMQIAAGTAEQLNDYDRLLIYGDRTLKIDPDNYAVMTMMATALAQRTREFDLDKEEKLKRATDYANKSMKVLETAPRPNPQVTDEAWAQAKKDFVSQAHEALALVAVARKDFDTAIAEFKTSVEMSPSPNPATKIRMANALNQAGKYDEALALTDQILADPQLNPQVRRFVDQERNAALKAKAAK